MLQKIAPKLLVAGDAPRRVVKRTALGRLNVVLGIVSVSLLAALGLAAMADPFPREAAALAPTCKMET